MSSSIGDALDKDAVDATFVKAVVDAIHAAHFGNADCDDSKHKEKRTKCEEGHENPFGWGCSTVKGVEGWGRGGVGMHVKKKGMRGSS